MVDEAGKSLPRGSAEQGLLYDESRYDKNDRIGSEAVPVFLETATGLVNATTGSVVPVPAELRAPTSREELASAQEELDSLGGPDLTTAIALPADPMPLLVASGQVCFLPDLPPPAPFFWTAARSPLAWAP